MYNSLITVKGLRARKEKYLHLEWRLYKNIKVMTLSWPLKYKWGFALGRGRGKVDIPGSVCKKR